MAVGVCERVVARWPRPSVYSSKRDNLVLLREGVDIAVDYFNFGQRENITKLTTNAKKWCAKYYKGYYYAPKRATGLLKTFPNLFNLEVEANLRLIPAAMAPTDHSEPEGATPRELRRAERKAANSETFPDYAEPTLADDDEMDEIVDLRPRRSPEQARAKPNMRVDAAMLRGTGLLQTLPEFLGQLARANLETETMLANDPDAVRFELGDDAAEDGPHIEMNLFAGVAEAQRRRHARRIILPGGRPFKLPGDDDEENDSVAEDGSSDDDQDDSGDESDASTSTTASLRVQTKKRKAAPVSDDVEEDDEDSQPSKIRVQYHHPTPILQAFDLSRRELITRNNPAANTENDPFIELHRKRTEQHSSSPTSSSSETSSSSNSSSSSKKVIKIKVVNHSSSSSASHSITGSSRNHSRANTPEFKIVRVSGAHSSPSTSSAASNRSSPHSSPRIKIVKRLRSVSPALDLSKKHARPSSPASDSSANSRTSSKSNGSSVKRIKLNIRSGHQEAVTRR